MEVGFHGVTSQKAEEEDMAARNLPATPATGEWQREGSQGLAAAMWEQPEEASAHQSFRSLRTFGSF